MTRESRSPGISIPVCICRMRIIGSTWVPMLFSNPVMKSARRILHLKRITKKRIMFGAQKSNFSYGTLLDYQGNISFFFFFLTKNGIWFSIIINHGMMVGVGGRGLSSYKFSNRVYTCITWFTSTGLIEEQTIISQVMRGIVLWNLICNETTCILNYLVHQESVSKYLVYQETVLNCLVYQGTVPITLFIKTLF